MNIKRSKFHSAIKEQIIKELHDASVLDRISDIILDLRNIQKELVSSHPQVVELIGSATNMLEDAQNNFDDSTNVTGW